MALVREIVECLLNPSPDSIKTEWDNYAEAIQRPKVVDGDFLRLVPGSYDPSVARFVYIVKGVKFVRSRDDPMWYPKEEDDLVGGLSAAHSVWFHDLGLDIGSDAAKDECRNVIMRVVSNLLNQHANGLINRLFTRQYKDFGYARQDFDGIVKTLEEIRYFGYVCENGRWRGLGKDESRCHAVGMSVCAMGLIESMNAEQAKEHVYVDIPCEEFERLYGAVGENEGAQRQLSSYVRKIGNNSLVRLLLSKDKLRWLCSLPCWRQSEEHHKISEVLQDDFLKAYKRWGRRDQKEMRYIGIFARILATDIFS